MFEHKTIDFKHSGVLNKLVQQYLEKQGTLSPFYAQYPDKEGFTQLLKTEPYKTFDRTLLSEVLLEQTKSVHNTSKQTLSNISKLGSAKAYTVTTGHQLCLFTGPLYFIYKLFSTVNLAESLKKEHPEHEFVPVYWMATEDHDFAEVNHFHSAGKTVRWESNQTGAVGFFDTTELNHVLAELREAFGKSENSDYLIDLFERSYLKNNTLAKATRYLVNELFGAYGLVVLDCDDAAFKQQFKAQFKADIFENRSYDLVNEQCKKLEALNYSIQVNARPINCFYMVEELRARIEKVGDDYTVVGTELRFNTSEMRQLIDEHPEKISPNVVLRPLYQQCILPNIAYVGGPGELAYWLEFKKMFDGYGVLFPILMPRNFVSIVDKNTQRKIDKLHFKEEDFFKSEHDLIQEFQLKNERVFELDEEHEKIKQVYAKILEKVSVLDKTLDGSVAAEIKRVWNGLDRLLKKGNKALRRKSETEINQIHAIKTTLFPGGIPQERHENFSSLYIQYGPTLFSEIKKRSDPFLLKQNIFIETQ